MSVSVEYSSPGTVLKGKYIRNVYKAESNIYYISPTANLRGHVLDDEYYVLCDLNGVRLIESKVYIGHYIGPSQYLCSSDRNAYPDSGIIDNYEYAYLGIPFDNAREAHKVIIGSYVGNGTYGEKNPNSLTFQFKPKVLFIYGPGYAWWFGQETGNSYTSGGESYVQLLWNENNISWYSIHSESQQLNYLGTPYHYLALG